MTEKAAKIIAAIEKHTNGSMKRQVTLGSYRPWETSGLKRVTATVELSKDGRLSICGNVPHRSGGQCQDTIREMLKSGEIRNVTATEKLLDIWDRWHLNDVRPECEHQRKDPVFGRKQIEVRYYKLPYEVARKIEGDLRKEELEILGYAIDHSHVESLKKMADDPRFVTAYAYYYTTEALGISVLETPIADSRIKKACESFRVSEIIHMATVTTKNAQNGFTRESEHDEGLLGRACHVCGYKYGSGWHTEEIPDDVLTYLATDIFGVPAENLE